MIKAGEELLRLQAENIRLKERIKQAREEIEHLPTYSCEIYRTNSTVVRDVVEIDKVIRTLDKLIESEGVNDRE